MVKDVKQYSLQKILLLWLLITVPMGLLSWVIAPLVIPISPLEAAFTYWILMIIGLVWQFIVSSAVIWSELKTFNWQQIRRRTWLVAPVDPKTKQPRMILFLWLIPAIAVALLIIPLTDFLDTAWINLLDRVAPSLQSPPYAVISVLRNYDMTGQWSLLGLAIITAIFNYFLGEEFFFRGVLLPKMEGVFGRWDWVANSALFALYHVHKPWALPGIFIGLLNYTYPSKVFRSIWFSIILHGIEGVILIAIVLAVIL